MDREYLEDYSKREQEKYERCVKSKIRDGSFSLVNTQYPSNERFIKLQKPLANTTHFTQQRGKFWAQVPFCGSIIFKLMPIPESDFEKYYLKKTEITELIDFIKQTGRVQTCLTADPKFYEGLDYLDPFFKELNPPAAFGLPESIFGNPAEIREAKETFMTLAKTKFLPFLKNVVDAPFKEYEKDLQSLAFLLLQYSTTYEILRLGNFSFVEDIENLMVDDPIAAAILLIISRKFIVSPIIDAIHLRNFTFEELVETNILPPSNRPQKLRFPYEIGKYLTTKLTYAPMGLRACYNMLDNYASYDLQKVMESLNEAIVVNNPDVINSSSEAFSEILDNVWSDTKIPRLVKGLKIGMPFSIAVLGSAAVGLIGGIGGFLAGAGIDVLNEAIDIGIDDLTESIAKKFAKNYQANVYDFKKKYDGKMINS